MPFPYVDRSFFQVRSALVVGTRAVGPNHDLVWAMMITSAANPPWPGDVMLFDDFAQHGLTAPSVIRTEKIAVVVMTDAKVIGNLAERHWLLVRERTRALLGF